MATLHDDHARRPLCSFFSAVITVAANTLFVPQGDGATSTVDSSADSTVNFLSLLLAFFPPGGTQPQTAPAQAPETSPALPDSLLASLFDGDVFFPLDGEAEQSAEDSSATLSGERASDQGLLLSFLTPFLQGTGQSGVDTAATAQLTDSRDAQALPSLQGIAAHVTPQPALPLSAGEQALSSQKARGPLAAQTSEQNPQDAFPLASPIGVDSAEPRASGKTIAPTLGAEGSDDLVSAQSLSPVLSQGVDSAVRLTSQDQGRHAAEVLTATVGEAPVPTPHAGAVDRGVLVRRYAAFGGALVQKSTAIPSAVSEPLPEGEPAPPLVLAFGGQGSDGGDAANASNVPSPSPLEAGDAPLTQSSKEQATAAQVDKAAFRPDNEALVRQVEENLTTVQTEQLTVGVSSRGKASDTARERGFFFSSAEIFTASSPGANTAVASQPRAEGTPHASNLESWRQVVDQVGEGIITTMQQENREARLQLAPPELGKLDIQLVVESGRLRAHIVAESVDVGALIQSHLPELKQALQTHRLDLDSVRVDVHTGGGEPNTFSQHSRQDEHARERGRALPVAPTNTLDTDPASRPPTLGNHGGRVSVWA